MYHKRTFTNVLINLIVTITFFIQYGYAGELKVDVRVERIVYFNGIESAGPLDFIIGYNIALEGSEAHDNASICSQGLFLESSQASKIFFDPGLDLSVSIRTFLVPDMPRTHLSITMRGLTNGTLCSETHTPCTLCNDGLFHETKSAITSLEINSNLVLASNPEEIIFTEHYVLQFHLFLEYEPICGDGVHEIFEECDDGNKQNGDGCSSLCFIDTIATNTSAPVTKNETISGDESRACSFKDFEFCLQKYLHLNLTLFIVILTLFGACLILTLTGIICFCRCCRCCEEDEEDYIQEPAIYSPPKRQRKGSSVKLVPQTKKENKPTRLDDMFIREEDPDETSGSSIELNSMNSLDSVASQGTLEELSKSFPEYYK
mmetsp:Transcript_30036/g.33550  ORF Transcript_30036/g.33550 Transcript_30036/m.33550 type:complete len:375 (+) Transcript_30036:41-1165(+)